MSWTDQGPVSTPPAAVVYGAAILVACAALAGAGLGFHAAQRGPSSAGPADQIQGLDQATPARPIVDLPSVEQGPVAAANPATNSASNDNNDDDDSNAIAVKQAAAQAAQSKPSQSASDILDQLNTSPSERPQAPAKPSSDESAPGSPSQRTDVPF